MRGIEPMDTEHDTMNGFMSPDKMGGGFADFVGARLQTTDPRPRGRDANQTGYNLAKEGNKMFSPR